MYQSTESPSSSFTGVKKDNDLIIEHDNVNHHHHHTLSKSEISSILIEESAKTTALRKEMRMNKSSDEKDSKQVIIKRNITESSNRTSHINTSVRCSIKANCDNHTTKNVGDTSVQKTLKNFDKTINNDQTLIHSSSSSLGNINLDVFFDSNTENANVFEHKSNKNSSDSLIDAEKPFKSSSTNSLKIVSDVRASQANTVPRIHSCSLISFDEPLNGFGSQDTDVKTDHSNKKEIDLFDVNGRNTIEQKTSIDKIDSVQMNTSCKINGDDKNVLEDVIKAEETVYFNGKAPLLNDKFEQQKSSPIVIIKQPEPQAKVDSIVANRTTSFSALSNRTPTAVPPASSMAIKKRRANSFLSNIISAPYKQKSLEFDRLFHKNIAKREILIADFYCAWYAFQGRLYISKDHFAFHHNIMGVFTKSWVLNCSDVVSISKANTALFIPNAIQIVVKQSTVADTVPTTPSAATQAIISLPPSSPSHSCNEDNQNSNGTSKEVIEQKFLLTSFTQRDKTFALLETVWKRSINQRSLSNQEISDIVHRLYGDDLGFVNSEECSKFFLDDPSDFGQAEMADLSSSLLEATNESPEPSITPASSPLSHQPLVTLKISQNSNQSSFDDNQGTSKNVLESSASEAVLEQRRQSLQSSKPKLSAKILENPMHGQNVDEINLSKFDNDDDRNVNCDSTAAAAAAATVVDDDNNNDGDQETNNDNQTDNGPNKSPSSTSLKSFNRFFQNAQFSLVEGKCRCAQHKGTLMIEEVLPYPVDYLFELLFVDQTFMRNLHTKRQTTGLRINPWMEYDSKDQPLVPIPEGDYDISSGEYRTMQYTVKVYGIPLVKTALTLENQYILQSDLNLAYCLLSQIKNQGVPYSDSFVGSSVWCLNACFPTNDDYDEGQGKDVSRIKFPTYTKLIIYYNVHYIKSGLSLSLMKSSIEKNSIQGFQDFLDEMLKMLKNKRFDFKARSMLLKETAAESATMMVVDDKITSSNILPGSIGNVSVKLSPPLQSTKIEQIKNAKTTATDNANFVGYDNDDDEDIDNEQDYDDDEDDISVDIIHRTNRLDQSGNNRNMLSTLRIIWATIRFFNNYHVRPLIETILPLNDSKLLTIVLMMLFAMTIVNWNMWKQFNEFETRLTDMINLIEKAEIPASSSFAQLP